MPLSWECLNKKIFLSQHVAQSLDNLRVLSFVFNKGLKNILLMHNHHFTGTRRAIINYLKQVGTVGQ
jgi:hypothetical protein